MKVLWLASWYPNKISPLEGDFIQRHAIAVSAHIPVTVCYVSQYGAAVPVAKDEVVVNHHDNVKEYIVFFQYKPTGFKLWDKVLYNLKYYSTYKRLLKQYISEEGLPDLVHVHVPMKAGKLAQWIQKKWGVPYFATEHAGNYVKAAPDCFDTRSFYYRRSVASIFKQAKLVTSVSQNMLDILQQKFTLKNVKVIHNTVNEKWFYYKESPASFPVFEFIHVSTMGYEKNLEDIFQAFSSIAKINNGWRLTLVGPADTLYINGLIEQYDLKKNVIFVGAVSNQEVARYMQASSAFLLFSRYENFPCVIIEALCCGLPVISSRVGGVAEAVDSSNGILVPPEDVDALQQAILYMLKHYDSYNRRDIAAAARARYSYEVIGNEFLQLYHQIR